MITDTLTSLIVAKLATMTGPTQQRKRTLIAAARGAFPSVPVNAALWAYLRNPVPAADADYRAAVLADTPVGVWPLDDISGTVVADLGATANPGAATNNVGAWTPRTPTAVNGGWAMSFDGSSDRRIAIPPHAAYTLAAGPCSIELWFKLPTPALTTGFLLDVTGIWQIYAQSTGSLGVFRRNVAGPGITIPVTGKLDNAWHHLVATVGGGSIRVYVDTTLISTQADVAGPFNALTQIDVGANRIGPSNLLNGMLDEIAFYATALSLPRITAHYNARL